jgi:hypothetical protein
MTENNYTKTRKAEMANDERANGVRGELDARSDVRA